tara:strand:- start:1393 stop:2163 length:771 start_codon:yes stop_codon:yes gene_type:complete
MLSINQIKYLKSLNQKKFRQKENKIVLDGFRIIEEAINQNIYIEYIWIQKDFENDQVKKSFFKTLKKNNIKYSFESEKDIQRISQTKNSQGILALLPLDGLFNSNLDRFKNNIVILDNISDPGNLGTIIRTCSWFGIDSIILTKNSLDVFNYKCVRSAMGGHFYIKNLVYLDYSEINSFLKINNYNVISTGMNGESINQFTVNKKWALILGSEAHGVSELLNYNHKICIPQKGNIESLNVSIAAGIILNKLTYHEK